MRGNSCGWSSNRVSRTLPSAGSTSQRSRVVGPSFGPWRSVTNILGAAQVPPVKWAGMVPVTTNSVIVHPHSTLAVGDRPLTPC